MADSKTQKPVTLWRHCSKSRVSVQYVGELGKAENEFCSRLCAVCEIFERAQCQKLRSDTIETLKQLMGDLHGRWQTACNECSHIDCQLKIKQRPKGFDLGDLKFK